MRIRKTIVASALAMMAMTGMAQTHYEANISVGGKAGVSLSQTFFSPTVPQGMKVGAVAGAAFRYIEELKEENPAYRNFLVKICQRDWEYFQYM